VFVANQSEAMTYIGADMPSSEQINRFSAASDHIILGTHGGKAIGDISYATNKDILKSIFYADEDMAINERGDYGDAKILTPNKSREAEIYFILD
jgi:hypothetical protein